MFRFFHFWSESREPVQEAVTSYGRKEFPMKKTVLHWCIVAGLFLCAATPVFAQSGRIFLPFPETIAIYEFNSCGEGPLADGAAIPDLSGNGLNATVIDNAAGTLCIGTGDVRFGAENREVRKVNNQSYNARIVVTDPEAFEMEPTQSFTVEVYIHHEDLGFDPNVGNWGILFGTWSGRVPTQEPYSEATSLWYGWGLMRFPADPENGWKWICSPVQPDGSTVLGFNEHFSDTVFHIPEGSHYLACVCDREAQQFRLYLDGANLVTSLALNPNWAFITPFIPGSDEKPPTGRFAIMNGENDPDHPQEYTKCQTPPAGFQIDAVRVTERALLLDEIGEAWIDIEDGNPTPSYEFSVIVTSDAMQLVPGQCVTLDGAESRAGPGRTIEKYEWKTGSGDFVEGDPGGTFQTSFAEECPGGLEVVLRVTDDQGLTAEGQITLWVETPPLEGTLSVLVDGEPAHEEIIAVAVGTEIDAEAAFFMPWPADVFTCDGTPVPAPVVERISWDLDGDGTEDAQGDDVPAWTVAAAGDVTVVVEAVNSAGGILTLERSVKVVDNGGNSQVFHTTGYTILHLEFNYFERDVFLDPAGDDIAADLSGNSLDMTFYDVADGEGQFDHLATVGGAKQFSDQNVAVTFLGGVTGARGEIENDEQHFLDIGPEESFTFEIYVRPGTEDCCDWSSLAGTFRARWDGTDAATRYGWGMMNLPDHEKWNWHFGIGAPGTEGGEQGSPSYTMKSGAWTYFACVVDRDSVPQQARLYVNGTPAGTRDLDPEWSFEPPDGAPLTTFVMFARERRPDEFIGQIIPGTEVDALRLQLVALTDEKIDENWRNILAGKGADPTGKRFVRGDCNIDNAVNIADAVSILAYLFSGSAAPTCLDAADVNDDGAVNIADAVSVLSYLFSGGLEPPPPFSGCGIDPTPDDLPPCVFPLCD